jgi:hypothetical protein
MDRLIITAMWDPEAQVWVAESEQLPIITEAPSLDALLAKLPGMIQDALEDSVPNAPAAAPVPFDLLARVDESAHVWSQHAPRIGPHNPRAYD